MSPAPSFDLAEYDDLTDLGYSKDEIAMRFGIRRDTLDRALYRRAARTGTPPPADQPMTVDPRRRAAVDTVQRDLPAPARSQGVRTGGGSDAHGLDLPVKATEHVDLFDRLAEAEERRRIRSPFGDHDATPRDRLANYTKTKAVDDPDRYVAPDINDDLWEPDVVVDVDLADYDTPPAEDEDMSTNDHETVPARTDSVLARTETVLPADTISPPSTCAGGACGELLTGGGAPRGWVLVRIIGAGPPRRYCCGACASTAILATTLDQSGSIFNATRGVNEVKPATAPSKTRQGGSRSPYDIDEIVLRYQAGETAPAIAAALGTRPKTIRDALDRAGIQRRDDRTDHGPGVATKRRMEAIASVGATVRDVREWAAATGRACGNRGTPSKAVVDAFLAARQTHQVAS